MEAPYENLADSSQFIHLSSAAADNYVPGGFWRRFVATVIDGCIVGITSMPISIAVTLLVVTGDSSQKLLANLISYAVQFTLTYFYYGWFYSHKGATPGKMIMKLRIIHDPSGGNLTYQRAFWRETVGKLLSAILLLGGYLMVAFRSDKKALHDLLFKTSVLKRVD